MSSLLTLSLTLTLTLNANLICYTVAIAAPGYSGPTPSMYACSLSVGVW